MAFLGLFFEFLELLLEFRNGLFKIQGLFVNGAVYWMMTVVPVFKST